MSDTTRGGPRYGTPNMEMIGRWLQLPAEADGPFWALNLMKYREVADYTDGRDSGLSGREADDAYAPLGPLAAIGAMVAFHGDVEEQSAGDPRWDRIGIVRYPTRAAFFAMQQRDDFKDLHEHKDAGMECTIVMSCLPTPDAAPTADLDNDTLILTVQRVAEGDTPVEPEHAGILPVVRFAVEGVIVGDERSWTHARFDRVDGEDAHAALLAAANAADEAFVIAVRPERDDLIASLDVAATQGDQQ